MSYFHALHLLLFTPLASDSLLYPKALPLLALYSCRFLTPYLRSTLVSLQHPYNSGTWVDHHSLPPNFVQLFDYFTCNWE